MQKSDDVQKFEEICVHLVARDYANASQKLTEIKNEIDGTIEIDVEVIDIYHQCSKKCNNNKKHNIVTKEFNFESTIKKIIKKIQLQKNTIHHILNVFGIEYIVSVFEYQKEVPDITAYIDKLRGYVGLSCCDFWDNAKLTDEILSHKELYEDINWDHLIENKTNAIIKTQFRKQIIRDKIRIMFTKYISKENFATDTKFVIIAMPSDNDLFCHDDNDDDDELREHQYLGILIDDNKEHISMVIDNLWCGGHYFATGEITRRSKNIVKIVPCEKSDLFPEKFDKTKFHLIVPSIEKFFAGSNDEIILDNDLWDID